MIGSVVSLFCPIIFVEEFPDSIRAVNPRDGGEERDHFFPGTRVMDSGGSSERSPGPLHPRFVEYMVRSPVPMGHPSDLDINPRGHPQSFLIGKLNFIDDLSIMSSYFVLCFF